MIAKFKLISKSYSYDLLKLLLNKIDFSAIFLCLILLASVGLFSPIIYSQTHYEGENFRLEIPADWEVFEQDTEGDIKEFIFIVPEEGEELKSDRHMFSTNVNIVVEKIAADFTLEEYIDIVLMQLESRLDDFNLLERSSTVLAEKSGENIEYTGLTQAGEKLFWQEWIIIENNSAYVITYAARDELYAEYKEEVDKMLDSFVFE